MLHILISQSKYREDIENATPKYSHGWVVPKSSILGETVLLFFPDKGHIIASAEISSDRGKGEHEKGEHGKRAVYVADISHIKVLPRPITLTVLKNLLPKWKWPTYPRSYTTVPAEFEAAIRKLIGSTAAKPAKPGKFAPKSVGGPYRYLDENVSAAPRDPFSVDPDKVDRGNRAHIVAQNALAKFLERQAIKPRSPKGNEPEADLLWEHQGTIYVAEVKSTTDENEERQLRLGLGQVLRYRHLFAGRKPKVKAVLIPERKPKDVGWEALCNALGVVLTWPGRFSELRQELQNS